MTRGQTIQIFLPSGNPQGLRQAEITTRTVMVFDVPRSSVPEFLETAQANQVALYFLFGSATVTDDRVECYIGETDDVGKRLKSHDKEKLFWDRALIAVSLTNTWTKAHVRYLENKAVVAGKDTGRYTIQNRNDGFAAAYTPAPLQADCDEFFETVSTLTATLGYPVLRPMQTKQATAPDRLLHVRGMRDTTSGHYAADGLTVFAGTVLSDMRTQGSNRARLQAQRDTLEADGVLTRTTDGGLVFGRDWVFSSPSGAACIILGRSSNGWEEWLDGSNRSLDQIERNAAEKVSGHSSPDQIG